MTSGIASTANVITSADLMMIALFLGFVLGEDPRNVKMTRHQDDGPRPGHGPLRRCLDRLLPTIDMPAQPIGIESLAEHEEALVE